MKKIVVSIVIGLLLAGAGTKIIYNCQPIDGAAGCAEIDKAAMHPGDLIKNKQNSLVHFSETFVITSLIAFVLISLYEKTRTKKAVNA